MYGIVILLDFYGVVSIGKICGRVLSNIIYMYKWYFFIFIERRVKLINLD